MKAASWVWRTRRKRVPESWMTWLNRWIHQLFHWSHSRFAATEKINPLIIQVMIFCDSFIFKNSHAILFTHLKYIMQCFLEYSQSCATITKNHLRAFLPPPKETSHTLTSCHPDSPFYLSFKTHTFLSLDLSILDTATRNCIINWSFVADLFHLA
jgi:hypothetical protein